MIRIDTHETWIKQEDGTMLLISSEEVEVDVKTPEEELYEKEQELLAVYAELQALKNK
jgi:hypothetical protein